MQTLIFYNQDTRLHVNNLTSLLGGNLTSPFLVVITSSDQLKITWSVFNLMKTLLTTLNDFKKPSLACVQAVLLLTNIWEVQFLSNDSSAC